MWQADCGNTGVLLLYGGSLDFWGASWFRVSLGGLGARIDQPAMVRVASEVSLGNFDCPLPVRKGLCNLPTPISLEKAMERENTRNQRPVFPGLHFLSIRFSKALADPGHAGCGGRGGKRSYSHSDRGL